MNTFSTSEKRNDVVERQIRKVPYTLDGVPKLDVIAFTLNSIIGTKVNVPQSDPHELAHQIVAEYIASSPYIKIVTGIPFIEIDVNVELQPDIPSCLLSTFLIHEDIDYNREINIRVKNNGLPVIHLTDMLANACHVRICLLRVQDDSITGVAVLDQEWVSNNYLELNSPKSINIPPNFLDGYDYAVYGQRNKPLIESRFGYIL